MNRKFSGFILVRSLIALAYCIIIVLFSMINTGAGVVVMMFLTFLFMYETRSMHQHNKEGSHYVSDDRANRMIVESRSLNEWPNDCDEDTDCEGCEYLQADGYCKLDN